MCFSLETASDYVKDDKACFYGFKCSVFGFEWNSKMEQVLNNEQQTCAGAVYVVIVDNCCQLLIFKQGLTWFNTV